MKTYIYIVNGTEFTSTTPWGQAWKDAKAMATEEHTVIERTIVRGQTVEYEIYVNGGCFLPDGEDVRKMAKIW